MNLKKVLSITAVALILLGGCKKASNDVVEEKVAVASAGPRSTFHSSVAYSQLYVYRYDDATAAWTKRLGGHYSTLSADSTSLGFTNIYVVDSGINLFGMPGLYSEAIGSSNTKEAKINVERLLQFFPSEEGSKKGVVKIIAQDVVVTIKAGGTFKIGLSGEGTYDETTKVIDLVVKFNDTAIGGAAEVKRTYKMSVDALTL